MDDDQGGGGELHEVELEDLLFYERCGGGTFGSVYRALWRSQNMIVAVKRLLVLEKEVKSIVVCVEEWGGWSVGVFWLEMWVKK